METFQVEVFLFGDYQYLCRMYGITGATGRHACLYCTVKRDDMKLPRDKCPTSKLRSLDNMACDLSEFKIDGGGKTQKAKNFNNVVRPPMLPIPLTHVCPPGLHISLGLFLKHYVSLENACHALDIKISRALASGAEGQLWNNKTFLELTENMEAALSLEEEAQAWRTNATALQGQMSAMVLQHDEAIAELLSDAVGESMVKYNEKKLAASARREKCNLKQGQGPLTAELDKTLQAIGVHRQAYHGKSFVGNHVHKCCKEQNIIKLTSSIVMKTKEICKDPQMVMDAQQLADKYQQLLTLFAKCHNRYNLARQMTEEEIKELDFNGKNAEDPSLTRDNLPSMEADTQLDILQFQNQFYECIEELKIRRATDAENEEKINQLVSSQHDHQRTIKEEISKNGALSEKHSQELCELRRQHEEKIHLLQAEKNKLTLAADSWEKEMKEIKDDIRTLQLTKYSLEKRIKDQDQRLQMQGSARSSHLSKMTELEAMGKDASKQCSAVAEQLKRLEVNVKEANKLHTKLAFVNQHQTCASDSLKADLDKKTEQIVCLRARLDEKPSHEVNQLKSVQSKLMQAEKRLKQTENACKQLSEQLEETSTANQNLLGSLARSQEISERHLASSNQNAEHVSSLATDVKKLQSELCRLGDDLGKKEEELQAKNQRKEELIAKFQIQEESLRKQLASQEEEKKSFLEVRETLEELNSNWSKKNVNMADTIEALEDKISEFEKREETKQTKSTNTDPELWPKTEAAEQKLSKEETDDKADNETVVTQAGKDIKSDDGECQKKAGDEVSEATAVITSCDQVNMQMETSTTEQAPSSAQREHIELAVAIKDSTPSPLIMEEVGLIHDNPGTQLEATTISPSDAKITTDISAGLTLEPNPGRVMEVAAKHETKTETSMQHPESPCGNLNKKGNRSLENTVIPAIKTNPSGKIQEIIKNTGVLQEGVFQVCPHKANKTKVPVGTAEALKAVDTVDLTEDLTEMPANLTDLKVDQVVLLEASSQIVLPADIHHQKPVNQSEADESPNILYNRATEKGITKRDLDATKSEVVTEIIQQTEEQPSKQTIFKRSQVTHDMTHGQHTYSFGRVNITNPLSSKRTSIFNQPAEIQCHQTSYLNEASRIGTTRTRSSYVLPGFSLLAAQPRCGVTPKSDLASGIAPRPALQLPEKTENIPGSTHSKVSESPSLGKYHHHHNPSSKCSSTKDGECSQEWPNFAEEFESASEPSSAPLNIDYSAPLRVKTTPTRVSNPAEVFPSVGSKRRPPSSRDDHDDEPLLFSDDDDDQTDIKTEVASQINRIQSFLRNDRLKRPRRSATNKGPVV